MRNAAVQAHFGRISHSTKHPMRLSAGFALLSRFVTRPLLPAGACLALAAAATIAGCDRAPAQPAGGAHAGIAFPSDKEIDQALQVAFAQDPDNARARDLVHLLGGDQGKLEYQVRRVIYRQGSFEAQYDVALHMGQDGAESLRQLYASMVPADEAAKLQDKSLAGYEQWLKDSAQALDKAAPQQAATLRSSLVALGACYRDRKSGTSVALMQGLAALVSPARDGWYAEKMQSPRLKVLCLPV